MPVEIPEETSQQFASLRTAEFTALRRTISGRGTARMVIMPVTCALWATLAMVIFLFGQFPVAGLLPLAVLAAGFEAIHALHVGAERIGRYLQVHYEAASDGPQWETAATKIGPALPGGGVDPLFSAVFVAATAINLITNLELLPTWEEIAVIGTCHAAFVFRVIRARIAASRQRAVELESFRAVLLRQRDRN